MWYFFFFNVRGDGVSGPLGDACPLLKIFKFRLEKPQYPLNKTSLWLALTEGPWFATPAQVTLYRKGNSHLLSNFCMPGTVLDPSRVPQ